MKKLSILFLFLAFGMGANATAAIDAGNSVDFSANSDSLIFAESFDDSTSLADWILAADAGSRPAEVTFEWAENAGVTGGALRAGGTNSDGVGGRAYIFEKIFTGIDFAGETDVVVSFTIKTEALVGTNVAILSDIGGNVEQNPSIIADLSDTEFTTFRFTHVGISESANAVKFQINLAAGAVQDQGGTVFIDDLEVRTVADSGGGGGGGEPTDGELLTNGDFENGADSWTGNAVNVLTEGDNSFNFADVETAGDAFSVNISQVIEIVPGEDYVFSFDASSSGDGRTMVVGIGLNEADWSSNVEVVTLADTLTRYTFELNATDDNTGLPFGIPNSRVIFDMGADTGVVVIDNVSLKVKETEPEPTEGELLTNGNFEAGNDGSWIGNALDIIEEGGNSFNLADVETAGDAFSVNLSQVVEITPGEDYVFTFDASSSGDGRTMVVGIGLNEADWSSNTEVITLADTLATYTLELNAVDDNTGLPFGIANSRVIFDMGADTGVVVIDNVSLKVKEGDPDPEPTNSLVTNGDFEAGPEPWFGNAVNVVTEGDNSFNLANVETAGNPFDVNISQIVDLKPGAFYKLSFDASSSGDGRTIVTGIGQSVDPFFADVQTVTLTDSLTRYHLNLTATFGASGADFGGPDTRVIFDLGADTGVVVLDNVVLVEVTPPPAGEELLTNGDFQAGDDGSWYGSGFNLQTDNENTFNIIDIEVEGLNPFDVNLSQFAFLKPNTTYKLTFDAVGTGDGRSMIAGIGQSEDPFYSNSTEVQVTSDLQTFMYEFATVGQFSSVPFGGAESRVLFDMGADTGIVVIDNVSLVEVTFPDAPGIAAPAPPAREAADVVSIFSDAYTNINVETFSAGFDDSDVEDFAVEGDNIKKYIFTNFAGIEFLNDRLDLTEMTHFHVDYWISENASLIGTVFNHKLSNWAGGDGEANALELSLNQGSDPAVTKGSWQSVDVPLDSFNPINGDGREDIAQYIISNNGLTIFIDNIYFYRDVTGGGGGELGDELLTNGDFENGSDSWVGNAVNVLTENENSFNFADVETAGDAFSVNVSQIVEITPSETYTFSFDAGSSGDGRTMVVGIGLNEANWEANVEVITLADTLARYTLVLDAIDDGTGLPFGIPNSRVIFDMGADTGVVVIDNVSLRAGSGVSNEEEEEINIPTEVSLEQNYPNPFNPSTNITFSLPENGRVTLEVFNITGQRVATLVDGFRTAGEYNINFNAANLASGIYLYRLVAGSNVQVRKMLLIK